MAMETVCQTPGAQFHTEITSDRVACSVDLPHRLDLTEAEAALLEANIHNVLELVLNRYMPQP